LTPLKANGLARSVTLSLLLHLDGQTTESNISGNYRIFRADGNVKGSLIEHTKYVEAAEALLQDLNISHMP